MKTFTNHKFSENYSIRSRITCNSILVPFLLSVDIIHHYETNPPLRAFYDVLRVFHESQTPLKTQYATQLQIAAIIV